MGDHFVSFRKTSRNTTSFTCNILDLPPEILVKVFAHTHKTSGLRLRMVCKELNAIVVLAMHPFFEAMGPLFSMSREDQELSDALLYRISAAQTRAMRDAVESTGSFLLRGHINAVTSKREDACVLLAWTSRLGGNLRSLQIESTFDLNAHRDEDSDEDSDDSAYDDRRYEEDAYGPQMLMNLPRLKGFYGLEILALNHTPCNDEDVSLLCTTSAAGRLPSLKSLALLNSRVSDEGFMCILRTHTLSYKLERLHMNPMLTEDASTYARDEICIEAFLRVLRGDDLIFGNLRVLVVEYSELGFVRCLALRALLQLRRIQSLSVNVSALNENGEVAYWRELESHANFERLERLTVRSFREIALPSRIDGYYPYANVRHLCITEAFMHLGIKARRDSLQTIQKHLVCMPKLSTVEVMGGPSRSHLEATIHTIRTSVVPERSVWIRLTYSCKKNDERVRRLLASNAYKNLTVTVNANDSSIIAVHRTCWE